MDRKSIIALMICAGALLMAAACGGGGGGGGNAPDTQAPSVPTGLVSSPVSTSQISLTWSASTDNRGVAGYRIYAVSDIQSKTTTTFLATSSAATYNHPGLVQSTYHCYYVSAYDAAGNESAKSNMACTTTNMEFYIVPDTGAGDGPVSRPPTYVITTGSTDTIVSYLSFTIETTTYPTYTIVNSTVTDSWTGLIWQQESDNIPRTWAEAHDYCNNLTLVNQSDWRLPTRKELLSIVYYAAGTPPWVQNVFQSAPLDKLKMNNGTSTRYEYWSATLVPLNMSANIQKAWTVNFGDVVVGDYGNHETGTRSYVRCVQGGQLPEPLFRDNGDGTVTDDASGLMWHKLATAATGTAWTDAAFNCTNSSLARQTWRLPNIRELGTLVDYTKMNPAIDKNYFTDGNTALNKWYWSSTMYTPANSNAWFINFAYGTVAYELKTTATNMALRCVRNAP